ncbi:MAG: presenilin family intramembrane aspartyl protease [archaeon]|jgi:presenilin-like A22 family membrane protease|nr:presenilin family intramembrane aspartyl protease [archaeon]
MKHSIKIVALLLGMFFFTQLIGLAVTQVYFTQNDNIPYGMSPPKDIDPKTSLFSIVTAVIFAVVIMLFLMKFNAELLLRIWFFLVVVLAIAITANAALIGLPYAAIVSLIIALPLAFIKIFRRNILVHNLTELLIYPGIAVIFIPLLNLWTVALLLILISLYDMYAVWHSGFMQKMAKYQIQKLKLFSGFFVPYIGKKERDMIKNASKSKRKKTRLKKIKISLAILGGGDVVFPMILAGVVFRQFGLLSAFMVTLGATAALSFLFYISKKGKFYPAMPFITAGCFIALGIIYTLQYLY